VVADEPPAPLTGRHDFFGTPGQIELVVRLCYDHVVTKKELHARALALPPEDRARLAHDIIASLDGPGDVGAAEAWVVEIERRVREVKDGSVRLVDWKDTRARILGRLTARK